MLETVSDDRDARLTKEYLKLGWKPIAINPTTKVSKVWAIEGTDGLFYLHMRGDPTESLWIRVNADGRAVYESGELMPDHSINADLLLTEEQVKNLAKVKTQADNIVEPSEMEAEILSGYRFSPEQTKKLQPQRYIVAKEIDDNEINYYQPPVNGKPQFIRQMNGQLVPNPELKK